MIDDGLIEDRKLLLRAHGVPEKFIDNLATRSSQPAKSVIWIFAIGWVVAMTLIPMLTMGPGRYIDAALRPLFYGHVPPSILTIGGMEATAVFSVLVFGGTITLFAVMILVATATARTRPHPAYNAWANILRTPGGGQKTKWRRPFAELADLPDDQSFLRAIAPSTAAATTILLAVVTIFFGGILGISLFSTVMMATHYWQVTPDAVVYQGSQGATQYPLKSAVFVESGCHGASQFDYRLVFPNRVFILSQASDEIDGLSPRQTMARLVIIDRRLQALGVPIRRYDDDPKWRSWTDKCIARASRDGDTAALRALVYGS